MTREASITYEQVAAAAEKLKAEGTKPTNRAVQQLVGGSMATVLKFMQQWKGDQTRQSHMIDDTVDPDVAKSIHNMLARRIQEATADTTSRLAELQTDTAAVIEESERQAAELERSGVELAAAHELCSNLTGRVGQQEIDIDKLNSELVSERLAAEHARTELAKAELRIEAAAKVEVDLAAVREQLEQERQRAIKAEKGAAVLDAQLTNARDQLTQSEARQTALSAHVDTLGMEVKKLNEDLHSADHRTQAAQESAAVLEAQLTNTRDQLAQSEARHTTLFAHAEALSKDVKKLSGDYHSADLRSQAAQARLESAARELDDLKERITVANRDARNANEQAAELRGELEAVRGELESARKELKSRPPKAGPKKAEPN